MTKSTPSIPLRRLVHWLITLSVLALAVGGQPAGTASAGIIPAGGSVILTGMGPIRFSPPTLVDLNNDGKLEVLVGTAYKAYDNVTPTNGGRVAAVQVVGGAMQILWSHDTSVDLGSPSTIRGAISAADLDGNGTVEVVVPVGDIAYDDPSLNAYGGLVVLNGQTGATLWKYLPYDKIGQGMLAPDGRPDGIVGAPALGDLDNDGDLEIVFGSYDHRIYVFHHDGTQAEGWPKFIRDTVWPSPALADLDDDGFLEMIFGLDTHLEGAPFNTIDGSGLYVYRFNGDLVSGWPKFISQTMYSSPAVGDLDGDGKLEIVHGTGDFFNSAEGRKVYAWNADGTLKWSATTGDYVPASPALGDINGDGKLDVVVGVKDTKVYAWNHLGTALWSKSPTNFQGNTAIVGTPALMDYDADNIADVLINIFWDTAVLKGTNGSQLTASTGIADPLPAYYCGFTTSDSAPAAGDIDGDGLLEMVVACALGPDSVPANQLGQTGAVVYWNTTRPATTANAPWPMFGQNARHTNLYPHSYAYNSEVVSHNIPVILAPGEQRVVTMTLRNTGTSAWTAASQIRLSAVGDGDPLTSASRVNLGAGDNIAAGQTKAFTITLKAPTTPGNYTTDWRMINDATGKRFGRTIKVDLKVSGQPELQVLTTQGIYAAGTATSALGLPAGYLDAEKSSLYLWKLTADQKGYHMLDKKGGYWYYGTFPLPSPTVYNDIQDMVLGPDGSSMYILRADGTVFGCNPDNCSLSFNPATPTGIQARSLALTLDGKGVYVVDGAGTVYRGGTAADLGQASLPGKTPSTLLQGQAGAAALPGGDVIRRIKLTPDGLGYYLMAKDGQIYRGGAAPALTLNYTPHTGEDWARDFELTSDGKGFYLLDRYNGIHAAGTAHQLRYNAPPLSTGDTGRDLELLDSRTYTVGVSMSTQNMTLVHPVAASGPLSFTTSVVNEGGVNMTWTASAPAGLTVSPASGSLAPGASQNLQVGVNIPQMYAVGTYTFTLTVTGSASGSSISLGPTLTLRVVNSLYRLYLPLTVR